MYDIVAFNLYFTVSYRQYLVKTAGIEPFPSLAKKGPLLILLNNKTLYIVIYTTIGTREIADIGASM